MQTSLQSLTVWTTTNNNRQSGDCLGDQNLLDGNGVHSSFSAGVNSSSFIKGIFLKKTSKPQHLCGYNKLSAVQVNVLSTLVYKVQQKKKNFYLSCHLIMSNFFTQFKFQLSLTTPLTGSYKLGPTNISHPALFPFHHLSPVSHAVEWNAMWTLWRSVHRTHTLFYACRIILPSSFTSGFYETYMMSLYVVYHIKGLGHHQNIFSAPWHGFYNLTEPMNTIFPNEIMVVQSSA